MATYAIGDIQGCYYAFTTLLARLNFNPQHDRLWLVGDLINRGNGSLEVLRWCYANQHAVVAVLGNHDLHALVIAEGFVQAHRGDTLEPLLNAPDCAELLNWLRQQHMIYAEHGYVMVHAGLLPQWSVDQALALGAEVEIALRDTHYRDFLGSMYGNLPNQWHDDLTGLDRLRIITNAMTRLRVCNENGVMEFAFKGELADVPHGLMPWFEVPNRQNKGTTIIFGHWSALATQASPVMEKVNVLALDTGCLWGGLLTAFCLETKLITQVPSDSRDTPIKKSFQM